MALHLRVGAWAGVARQALRCSSAAAQQRKRLRRGLCGGARCGTRAARRTARLRAAQLARPALTRRRRHLAAARRTHRASKTLANTSRAPLALALPRTTQPR
jgi:hypothetical protein